LQDRRKAAREGRAIAVLLGFGTLNRAEESAKDVRKPWKAPKNTGHTERKNGVVKTADDGTKNRSCRLGAWPAGAGAKGVRGEVALGGLQEGQAGGVARGNGASMGATRSRET